MSRKQAIELWEFYSRLYVYAMHRDEQRPCYKDQMAAGLFKDVTGHDWVTVREQIQRTLNREGVDWASLVEVTRGLKIERETPGPSLLERLRRLIRPQR